MKLSLISLLFFGILFLSFGSVADAQSYRGVVVSESDAPVTLANVMVVDRDTSLVTGCVTQHDGEFILSIPQDEKKGQDSLFVRITCLNFQDTLLPLSMFENGRKHIVVLKSKVNELDEALVRGNKSPFTIKDGSLVANVSEVSSLKNSGSLDDLLSKIPFVYGSGGNYSILGTGGSATIYVDTHKVQDPEILRSLRSQEIKSVEVINSPGAGYKSSVKSVIKITTIRNRNVSSVRASQYVLVQRKLSSYTGGTFSRGGEKSYLGINVGYSHTSMNPKGEDTYTIDSEADRVITRNSTETKYVGDFFIGGVDFNSSVAKSGNLGLSLNLNVGNGDFGILSKEMTHRKNTEDGQSTSAESEMETKPVKMTADLYYDGRIGKTSFNITDEILVGRVKKGYEYQERNSNVGMGTTGEQSYMMNSVMVSLKTPLKGILMGYGLEVSLSRNKNDLYETDWGIDAMVESSKVKNQQTIIGSYIDFSYKIRSFQLYCGMRYEYERSYYTENGHKSAMNLGRNPHFLNPMASVSYKGGKCRLALSYRSSVERPSYSSLNNFTLFENRFVYQQSNPLLKSQRMDVLQLIGMYGNLHFSVGYSRTKDASMTVLDTLENHGDVVLKRTGNIPHYSKWSVGLNWRRTYGVYTASVKASFQSQSLKFDGERYKKPMYNLSCDHYFDLKGGWGADAYIGYVSSRDDLCTRESSQWMYNLSVQKRIKKFTLDVSVKNLFLDRERTKNRAMNNVIATETEKQDFSGISMNISYRLNSVRSKYRNAVTSEESKRF